MAVKVVGITLNVLMILILLFFLFFAFYQKHEFDLCLSTQSTFCFSIQCPCDVDSDNNPLLPCAGYAQRQIGDDQYVCSLAPKTVVDSQGSIVGTV